MIYRSRCTVRFPYVGTDATVPDPARCVIMPAQSTTEYTDLDYFQLVSQKYARHCTFGGTNVMTGKNFPTVSSVMTWSKFQGRRLAGVNYESAQLSDPVRQFYWYIYVRSEENSGFTNWNIEVHLTAYCVLYKYLWAEEEDE